MLVSVLSNFFESTLTAIHQIPLEPVLTFLAVTAVSLIVLRIAFRRLSLRVARSEQSSVIFLKVLKTLVESTYPTTIFLFSILLGLSTVGYVTGLDRYLFIPLAALAAFQVAHWLSAVSLVLLASLLGDSRDASVRSALGLLSFASRIGIWSIATIVFLSNIGIDVTALVAGLGIGGIAVAFALQNILGDLFASLSIILDKPFEVGDFIIVDDVMGNVEHIGVKTTRIRSLAGEQILMSNSDLLRSRIRNFKRMYERRMVFSISVTYETPREKVSKVAEWIKEIVMSQPLARFDRAHFNNFGSFALTFEVVYFVKSPEFATSMDIQQQINLAIMQKFEVEEVQFAYPTQVVHVANRAPQRDTTAQSTPA